MHEPAQTTTSLHLSEQDVHRLLTESSGESRADVVMKIAANYNRGDFSDRELPVAEQIFRLLAKDGSLPVRSVLAELLKQSDHLPRDVALTLAHDYEDAVATPILQHSTVLSEYDLVRVVERASDMPRLLAIAQRKLVPERVSAALVDTGRAPVVGALIGNQGARLNEQSYSRIIQTFQNEAEMMASLAQREHLPVTVAEALVSYVSEATKKELRSQYRLQEAEVSRQTQSVREHATLRLLDGDPSLEAHAALVTQMLESDRLTPSLLLSALCRGNVLFFEMALAHLAAIPLSNAQLLIHDRSGLGLTKLYAKTGLPESLLEATRATLQVVKNMEQEGEQPGTLHFANRAVAQLLLQTDANEVDNLSYIIALIRQQGKAA